MLPPTANQDPRLPQRSITVAGKKRAIHTETFGNPANPAIFLLHDALGDYRAFKPFQALSDRYFVVMWDRRGDGLSERITSEEYSFASIVEEIDALKAIHSPNAPLTLIGHGYGASYAALYMSQRPASVRQALLMEPVALKGQQYGDTFYTVWSDSTWKVSISKMLWQSEAITPVDHETIDYKALTLPLDGYYAQYFCDPDNPPSLPMWRPGGYVEYLREGLFEGEGPADYNFDFTAGLDTFPAMVRILVGDCSKLGFDYQNANTRPFIQHAEIVVLRGAGHRMFVEQPDQTLAAVKDYLSEY